MNLVRPTATLCTVSLLVVMAACHHGGGGAGTADTKVLRSTVVYDRDNADGGSDLFRANIDGRDGPVSLTRHRDTTKVLYTWPDSVDSRIVYVAEKNGALDFYSVATDPPPGSGPAFTKLTDTRLGTTVSADWQIVGNRIVVKAAPNGVDNLYSVATDHVDVRALTSFTAGTIVWPRDQQRQRNAVTKSNLVVFQHETASGSTVYGVPADGSLPLPRQLSTGQESAIGIDGFGRPMITDDTVVVREFRPSDATTQFRACKASEDGNNTPLTNPLPASEQVTDAGLLNGRFVYVIRRSGIVETENVLAISLTAPLSQTGAPQPAPLTNFSQESGADVTQTLGRDNDNTLAILVEFPTGEGVNGTYADAFSVRFDDPQSLKQLTRRLQPPANDDAFLNPFRSGDFLVFGRSATANAVWQVELDRAASEVEVLPGQPGNYEVAVERAVPRDRQVDPTTGAILSSPTAEIIDHVLLSVTTDLGFTNYYSATPTNGTLRVVRLSNQQLPAGHVLQVKGDSIVYLRDGSLYAARIGVADSEVGIFDSAATVTDVFHREGQGATNRVLFFANGKMFSTRVDQAASVVRATLEIGNLAFQTESAEIRFNTSDRVVYTVTGFGRTVIVSSPIAEATVARTQLSDSITGEDRFMMAF